MEQEYDQPDEKAVKPGVVVIDLIEEPPRPRESSMKIAALELEPSTARNLYYAYRQNSNEAEETALNYLTSKIHHPVISCFREITKADIINIFSSTQKLRKSYNNLESSILCLCLIDYLAVCVDNPLYNENGKLSYKSIPKIITKILDEFKGTLRKWGLNGQSSMQKRFDIIFSLLRRLIPCFKAINYDIQFSEMINSLENETRKKKLQKSLDQPASSLDAQANALLELQISNMLHSTIPDASPSKTNNQKESTKAKLQTSAIVNSTPPASSNKSEKNDNLAVHNVSDSTPRKQTNPAVGIKRPLAKVSLTSQSQPVPKVQKVAENQVAPNTKPLIDAFEILMNRSRQLAQQRKADLANRK